MERPVDRKRSRAINIYIRPIPWTPPSRGTEQPSSPTNNNNRTRVFRKQASKSNMHVLMGFFPARSLRHWGAGNSPQVHLSGHIYWLGKQQDTVFCSLPCYSCSHPPRPPAFWVVMRGVVRTCTYAPNKTVPESPWRGRLQSRGRLYLSPKSFFLFIFIFIFIFFFPPPFFLSFFLSISQTCPAQDHRVAT